MLVRPFRTVALVTAVVALAVAAPAGASFSVVPSPNVSSQSMLNGVSASSPSDAWAVGSSCCPGRRFGFGTLTEHWNGSTWTTVPSPDTRLFDDLLNAVVASSPTNAWAVGEIKQSGYRSGNPLILHWNGAGWQNVAAPAGVTGELLAASRDRTGGIWAVGDDHHGKAVIVRCGGAGCAQVPVPQAGAVNRLRGVKAFGPSDAWAVGDRGADTLVMHWNGAAWSVVPSPNPDPFSNILNAVAVSSRGGVWAVGQKARNKADTGVPPGTRTLAMRWNGSSWSAVATPNIGDQDTLRGIAVLAGRTPVAVGWYQNTTTGALRTLAERWNGSAWATVATPNVGAADNLLKGATSIPGTPEGWLVGEHLTAGGGPIQTLVLRGS
jgi:hypothetical protein